jgi:hypothetical protein
MKKHIMFSAAVQHAKQEKMQSSKLTLSTAVSLLFSFKAVHSSARQCATVIFASNQGSISDASSAGSASMIDFLAFAFLGAFVTAVAATAVFLYRRRRERIADKNFASPNAGCEKGKDKDVRSVPDGMICPKCHRGYDIDARFCPHDAARLVPYSKWRLSKLPPAP